MMVQAGSDIDIACERLMCTLERHEMCHGTTRFEPSGNEVCTKLTDTATCVYLQTSFFVSRMSPLTSC